MFEKTAKTASNTCIVISIVCALCTSLLLKISVVHFFLAGSRIAEFLSRYAYQQPPSIPPAGVKEFVARCLALPTSILS